MQSLPQHDGVMLLWDIAEEWAKSNGHTKERNWLALMRAFWRGEFGQQGLILRQEKSAPHQGTEEFTGFTRQGMVGVALGAKRVAHVGLKRSYEQLLGWTLNDYASIREAYRYYFTYDPHGMVGLGISREEYVSSKFLRTGPRVSFPAATHGHAFEKQWARPQPDWRPLREAIFRYGAPETEESTEPHEKPPGKSTEAEIREEATAASNENWSNELIGADNTDHPMTHFSLDQLTEMLKKKSGAKKALIDRNTACFSFHFSDSPVWGAPPWEILHVSEQGPLELDPRLDAESLFNKEGLVRNSDEQAARTFKQWEAIYRATGLVWRLIISAFNEAVGKGKVILYARIRTVTAPFEELPVDAWAALEVVDWQNGKAWDPRDPQGILYYSIHVFENRARPIIPIAGNESAAARALASQLKSNPELKRAKGADWCAAEGFHLTRRGFENRVWPKARVLAGLEEKGRPGAKRKSPR